MAANSIGSAALKMVFDADEFIQSMDKTDRALQRMLRGWEKETGRTAGQMSRDIQRSVGAFGQGTTQAALSSQHAAVFERNRWQAVQNLGRGEMVAPREMSRAEARLALRDSELRMDRFSRGLGVALVAAEGIKVAIAGWKGSLKDAQEALGALPFGIGAAARTGQAIGESLRDYWVDRLVNKSLTGHGPVGSRAGEDAAGLMREEEAFRVNQMTDMFRRASWESQASAQDREKRAVLDRYNSSIDKIKETTGGALTPETRRAALAAEQLYWDQTVAIETRYADAERIQQDQANKEKLARERRAADELLGVRTEIDARALELSGQSEEAQRQRLRESYMLRIRDAREAGNAELAGALGILRDMDLMQAQPGGRRSGGQFGAIDSKYVDAAALSVGDRPSRTDEDSLNLLKDIAEQVRRLNSAMVEGN
jgi:hypothetical protein